MNSYEFPLLDFFISLHKAGLPLGLGDYKALLKALQGGFGHDVESLKRVCKALWITSPDEEYLFNYQFRKIELELKHRLERVQAESGRGEELIAEPEQQKPEIPAELPQKPASALVPKPQESEIPEPVPIESSELMQIEDETEAVQAVTAFQTEQAVTAVRIKSQDIEIPYIETQFILSGNYFPITKRQMKQSWRYLRRFVREGVCEELDVEATVDEIGRQGFFLKPVMVPRRKNRIELLMLIDQDGSMVPFHTLSERLKETAIRGGRLGKASVYYFHNYPIEWLYHDSAMIEADKTADVLARLHSSYTNVLIISDAGAARSWLCPERVELTLNFLNKLKFYVSSIVWLNPMPRLRWLGTTAGEINRYVPMFEMSRRGLDHAISTLRRHA